jgi:hypothetical protein
VTFGQDSTIAMTFVLQFCTKSGQHGDADVKYYYQQTTDVVIKCKYYGNILDKYFQFFYNQHKFKNTANF